MNVSIVVVNYNGGPGVVRNLRSMLESAGQVGSELIVVDNASTDRSADAIRRELPDVTLIEAPANAGYAAGVNLGLGRARGDTLVVMNADVAPRGDAIARLARTAAATGALSGGAVLDESGRTSRICFRRLPVLSDIMREAFFFSPRTRLEADAALPDGVHRTDVVSGSVMALSRETLVALGPMGEEYFLYNEDVEWCRRARARGVPVCVDREARFEHEGGASTSQNEGPPFAARVLSDFHYYCDIEGVPQRTVRRRWLARLAFRSFLYWLDASLGVLGRRPESRKRSAIYRMLYENLRAFSWAPTDRQKCHPSRLASFPRRPRRAAGDERPTVLLVVPDLDHGGIQRRVEYVTGGPLSERYRFEVLCLRRSGPIGERISDRVMIHEVGVERWTSPATWRRVRDYCALLEPDLVHSGTFPADVAAFVGFGRRVPRMAVKVSVDLWMSPVLRLIDRVALRGARLVYCVGDEVARVKSYLGRDGMLPAVIPNPPMIPIDDAHPAPFPDRSPVRVACIGRLAAVKRVDVFLRVARALEAAHPGRFEFRVLGDGRERPSLEALARELGVGDLVDFAGAVADVPGALAAADIVPMFSSGEGGPFSVVETIARGRVPVVLRSGGAVDVLPSELAECYVDRLDVGAYVGKIEDIVSRPGYYLDRVHAAKERLRARVRFHDAALESFYGDAVGRDSGHNRVRVLHLITRLIVGGAQENTIASTERVDPSRYESHLWIGPQTGLEGSLLSDARSRGIIVRVLPNLVREINPLRDLVVLFQLTRLMRRERFDIVHTHASKAGILGRVAAKLAGVPHITHTLHGWGFHDRMHPLLRWIYANAERVLGPWTRPLISVSIKTTEVGLAAGIGEPSDYRLIRSGIPLHRFHPDDGRGRAVRGQLGIPEGHVVVGSVGRLASQKNPMDFVKLAAALHDRHENITFVYVGDGPMRASVEQAAKAAGLGDGLVVLGVRGDVPDLLRAMDVFVLTSLWEGLPRVVLQALATGVPVLAYDTGGIAEAVAEGVNGHLVPRGALGEMADRLAVLIEDAPLRAKMGRAAAEDFDTSFSEEQMILDLENLYDGMLRSRVDRPS